MHVKEWARKSEGSWLHVSYKLVAADMEIAELCMVPVNQIFTACVLQGEETGADDPAGGPDPGAGTGECQPAVHAGVAGPRDRETTEQPC